MLQKHYKLGGAMVSNNELYRRASSNTNNNQYLIGIPYVVKLEMF